MYQIPVSINLVVRNEQERLPILLPLLKEFDEVVIVDQESTDNTVEICKSFGYNVLSDKATGFADTSRQFCMDSSRNEWILTLDADEFITNRLKADIPQLIAGNRYDGVFICRGHIAKSRINKYEDVLSMGYEITIPHYSEPYCWRLYRKGYTSIEAKLHTCVRPRHYDVGLYLHYNGIISVKSEAEHQVDLERYNAVANNCYNPALFP